MRRRTFLSALSFALADSLAGQETPKFAANPFQLGVASGDPAPDGAVLWTRLMGENLRAPIPVSWVVASDEKCSKIVKKGVATAAPDLAHSVHVEVSGLAPNRPYWYRFTAGKEESPIGRTRTSPAAAAGIDHLRFAFASCQHYETGLYTAYDHMVQEDLDLIVFLGDYIYENGPSDGRVRRHNGPEIMTLADYRNRYTLYRGDEKLQRAHAHAPWIVTWDDHEVDNDYANDHQEHGMDRATFMERRAAAYQAYYEHMPLRIGQKHHGTALQLYRRLSYGNLAEFHVLDTRQFRDPQPCGGSGTRVVCAESQDPKRTILGAAQTKWLLDGLDQSKARWNVLANQVIFAPADFKVGPEIGFSMDKWSGYEASRNTVMDFLSKRKPQNPVVITGDVHSNWAFDLRKNWQDPQSEALGVEFVGTSITSSGDGMDARPDTPKQLAENPHLRFFNAQRGYVKCTVTPKEWQTEYRVMPFVTKPGAPISTRAKFVVEDGRKVLQQA
ncbi:alkaline phosphatase D family protein [Paludibaculum fermentans]|uniref:alkaline phosphatase D family protein n=1 Tax=Paludibaculum fermentans TaxID=1473598 RepID=UPI003EBBA4CA